MIKELKAKLSDNLYIYPPKGGGGLLVVVLGILISFVLLSIVSIFRSSEVEGAGGNIENNIFSVVSMVLAPFIIFTVIMSPLWIKGVRSYCAHKAMKGRDYKARVDLNQNFESLVRQSIIFQEYGFEQDNLSTFRLIQESNSWKFYEVVFNCYRGTRKHGTRLAFHAHYTVMEFKLNGRVPHVVFDSRSGKGDQFRNIYSQPPRDVSFGGGFEKFYTTYYPEYYHIDILSFVSPEVVEAMLGMKQYDIEFLDNRLFCYAPMLRLEALKSFSGLCFNLYLKVNDNLLAYKDDRLWRPRERVTPFGSRLLKDPRSLKKRAVIFGMFAILTALTLPVTVFMPVFVVLVASLWCGFIASTVEYYRLVRFNEKQRRKFFGKYEA